MQCSRRSYLKGEEINCLLRLKALLLPQVDTSKKHIKLSFLFKPIISACAVAVLLERLRCVPLHTDAIGLQLLLRLWPPPDTVGLWSPIPGLSWSSGGEYP